MNIVIDVSVYLSGGRSFGRISGTLALPMCPQPGDVIDFGSRTSGSPKESFAGVLSVTARALRMDRPDSVFLTLSDLTVEEDSALQVMNHFEQKFGLEAERWD